jgi:hypothetical protein
MKTFAVVDDVLNIHVTEFLALSESRYAYCAYMKGCQMDYNDYLYMRKCYICRGLGVSPRRFHIVEL